jgi:sulfide:quinone oxidoreductase
MRRWTHRPEEQVVTAHIVIVGGGTGGISVAARLRRSRPGLKVTLVEPRTIHYYQPLWTLVGGGLASLEETRREMAEVVPEGVRWVQEEVAELQPDQSRIRTRQNRTVAYDALVLAPGLRIAIEEVEGLEDALEKDPRVWTNYLPQFVTKGPTAIEAFTGGNALFTFPRSPLKCGGAPQKIMWIAEETFRHNGVREKAAVRFVVPGDKIFGIPKYREILDDIAEERQVELVPKMHLIEVRRRDGVAVFENVDDGTERVYDYGLLHVAPPSRAPDFVIDSPLADTGGRVAFEHRSAAAQKRKLPQGGSGGFVEVDRYTTQHVRYPNVFAIGDASNLPAAKTGAAIRKQSPVLVENLLAFLDEKPLSARYDGYSSCPLVMGHHSVMLAEFKYDGEVAETFPFDQAKPRYSMWLLKRYILPLMYWQGMMKGRV